MRRRPPNGRRGSAGIRLSAGLLAAAGLVAAASWGGGGTSDGGSLAVTLAKGTLAHDNSRAGSAILTAGSVWPGWSGQGDVTISNSGSSGSWLQLSAASVDELPGPNGGRLGDRLTLEIEDVTVPGFAVPAYSGSLGGVGERWLGRMEPGDARSYRFRTTMPSGPGDNEYQSSSVSVRFTWAVSDTHPDSPIEDPPGEDPPAGIPDDRPIQVVPDGEPVIVVNRGALRVTLAVPSAQRPLRSGSVLALAGCSRSCTASARGVLGTGNGVSSRRLAGTSRALAAGTRTRIRMKIGPKMIRAARRTLARGGEVRGRVWIVAMDRAGRTATASQPIRLVAGRLAR